MDILNTGNLPVAADRLVHDKYASPEYKALLTIYCNGWEFLVHDLIGKPGLLGLVDWNACAKVDGVTKPIVSIYVDLIATSHRRADEIGFELHEWRAMQDSLADVRYIVYEAIKNGVDWDACGENSIRNTFKQNRDYLPSLMRSEAKRRCAQYDRSHVNFP